MNFISRRLPMAALACCAVMTTSAVRAEQSETIAPRVQIPLISLPGKTFSSAIVTFAPGVKAGPHRHGDAFVYAYVLSGAVRSQLDDQPAKIYRAGEDWYEPPGTHHKVTANISKRQPARLLVVFIATSGSPLKIPD